MIGETVSHYKILTKLGEGGMGVVYKAEDTRLKREVAIKLLPHRATAGEEERQRLKIEAQAAAALNHQNIASIYASEEIEDDLFIVMEYVSGEELTAKLARGLQSLDEVVNISLQLADGLEKAHEKGIVHRDIKPSNIMITAQGQVKILDFGLAKLTGRSKVTEVGVTLGTAAYMSPEQIQGQEVDLRSDIFSWAVVFYEMLTGQLPFHGEYGQALMYSIIHDNPESLRSLRPEAPAEIELILNKALAKDPAARYQQTTELVEDLQTLNPRIHSNGNARSLKLHAGSVVKKNNTGWVRTSGILGLGKQKIARTIIPATLIVLTILMLLPSIRQTLSRLLEVKNIPVTKQIAVLPFTNIGGDPGTQALCNGLVETLTSKLSQLEHFHGALWVVPASEVRKSKITTAGEARQLFGANLVINGSMQRMTNLLRLVINLIDAKSLRQLSSQLIDDPMTNALVWQDAAVVKLAEMLNVELKPETRRVLQAGGTTVPGAYEFYLQGRGYLLDYNKIENINSSIQLFEKALRVDPRYALAYAGLGEAYLRKFQATKEVKWIKLAETNCQRAVEIDRLLAPVHVTNGMLYTETGKYQQALSEFQKALELNSHNADAYLGRAKAFMARGQLDEAEATYKKAISVKPGYWGGYNDLGVFYYRHGRYEDAIEQFKHVIGLTPKNAKGYRNLGSMYYSLNRNTEAIDAYEKSIEIKPGYATYNNVATLYFHSGKYEDAAVMYEKALEIRNSDYRVWGDLASTYYQLPGENDKAEAAIRQAIIRAEEQLKVNPNNPYLLSSLAGYYLDFGGQDKSRSFIKKVAQLNPKDLTVIFRIGYIFERLDQRKDALKWIEKALKKGYPLTEVDGNPGLSSLRNDSRFQQIRKKLDSKNKAKQ